MSKRTSRDSRLSREGEIRSDRATEDREVTQNRELTDAERLDALRTDFFQASLPNLPDIQGFHVCWLTTTNPRDPIHGRIRLGYTPIKGSDIPGWEHATIKSGEHEGLIGVNEMLAFKLPIHLYERYMRELHHTQPQAEEEKLSEAVRDAQERAKQVNSNATLTAEEGTAQLGRAPEPPSFSEHLNQR